MFKNKFEQVTVLGVCVDEPTGMDRTDNFDFCSVQSGRRAIDMMRMLSFDLVMVGTDLPDIGSFDLVRRIRGGWSSQKWALVGDSITDQDEIAARMLGSVRIYDVMPDSTAVLQLASGLRAKARTTVLTPNFDQPYRSAASF